jgi:hypothetical protein
MRAARVGDRPGLLVEVGTSWDDAGMHKQFAEVRLSAKGINDGRIHTIWKAQVTSEGLVKVQDGGDVQIEKINR